MELLGWNTYMRCVKTATISNGSDICFEGHQVRLKTDPQLAVDTYIKFVQRDHGKLRDLIHDHLFHIGMRQAIVDLVRADIFDACSREHPKPYIGKEKEKWLADEEKLISSTVAWLKLLNESWED
jgi:hypothetical protein